VFTVNAGGGTVTLYIDGVQQYTWTRSITPLQPPRTYATSVTAGNHVVKFTYAGGQYAAYYAEASLSWQ
jgi:hypothetical protein